MSEPTFEGVPEESASDPPTPFPGEPTPTPDDKDTGTYPGGQFGTPGTSGDDVVPSGSPDPVDPAIPEEGTDLPDPGADDGSQDPPGERNVPI